MAKIESAMALVRTKLIADITKLPIDRESQINPKNSYPFGSYKILNLFQVSEHSASKKSDLIPIPDTENFDPLNMLETTSKVARATISLSFVHDKSLAAAMDLASRAMDYFDSIEGLDACQALGLSPKLVSGDIQDRTIPMDTVRYDYRAGFDLQFDYYKITTKQVGKISTPPVIEEI
jgi:hypothetical protein